MINDSAADSVKFEFRTATLGMDKRTRAWMEISTGALQANLRKARQWVGPAANLIPMVKADAYGLGVSQRVE